MAERPKLSTAALLVRTVIVDGCFFVGGTGLLTYGAWLVYAPAGFLTAGVLLLAAGLRATR